MRKSIPFGRSRSIIMISFLYCQLSLYIRIDYLEILVLREINCQFFKIFNRNKLLNPSTIKILLFNDYLLNVERIRNVEITLLAHLLLCEVCCHI